MDAKSKTMPPREYKDFNPLLEWIRGEKLDVALIHVPGFKKEQLKVEIDTHGKVCASGERPFDTDGQQWQRFSTNLQISGNCDINSTRAKFENNTLHIFFPKLVTGIIEVAPEPAATDKEQQEQQRKEKKADEANNQKKKPLPSPSGSLKPRYGEAELESFKQSNGKAASLESLKLTDGRSEGTTPGAGGMAMELTQARKQPLMNVAAATLVLFGLGFYLKYKFTKEETR